MTDIHTKAGKLKLLALDVDGVLTDGRMYYGNNGEEFKTFNIKSGLGIKLLQRGGAGAVRKACELLLEARGTLGLLQAEFD